MKLRRIQIGRLPGIDEPFALEDLGDGFHIIVGPNGIGKSSVCRAARALFWREAGSDEGTTVSALFELAGASWWVERDGSRHRWQRDGVDTDPPPLPADHLQRCFFLGLRDLLELSPDAGRDVAAEIRRQMSGGFDLEGAAESAFGDVSPRHGRSERNELSGLDADISIAERNQEEVAQRQSELTALEQKAADAESSQRELGHLERALEVQSLREALDAVEQSLRQLPEALANLTGNEVVQLDEREGELVELRTRRQDKVKELDRACENEAAARLGDAVDAAALSTWRTRADHLASLEARLETETRDWQGKRAALTAASRVLGGRAIKPPAIDLEGDGDLFMFLREAWHAEQDVESLRQQLALLEQRTFSPEDQQRLDQQRRAVEALRAWLRAPDPGAGFAPIWGWPRWQAIAAAGAALLLAGAGLAAALHPAWAALSGGGLGLLIAAWLFRPDSRGGFAREAAARDFPPAIAPPAAWTHECAVERLRTLESEFDEIRASAARARDRAVERLDRQKQLDDAELRRSALDSQRRDLATALGLSEIPANAELVDTARALDQLRRAHESEHEAAERVRTTAAQHSDLLIPLAAVLAAHGEPAPGDAAAARAAVTQLADRDTGFRAASNRRMTLTGTLAELDGDLERVETAINANYQAAGLEPGDRADLMRLIEKLADYRDLKSQRDALEKSTQLARLALERAGKSKLADMDTRTLESDKAVCETRAASSDSLRREIANVRAEVKQAKEGHQLEEMLGKRVDTVQRLKEKRDEVLHGQAGRFLLGAVRKEHETIQMPRVLERARELFGNFTQGTYELKVAPDDAASFVAIESRTGAGRAPNKLSDGTRVQLLLAARLAFAEEAERGSELPFFLDEALDQSDPVRFQAIARSLARMVADERRQIFYLTNDPTDERRIQAALSEEGCPSARTIDLAAVRRRTRAVASPELLAVERLPAVPQPADHTPESYAVRLGVPRLEPRRGASDQHIFYLLYDALDLLHELLERRIEFVGQWQALSRLDAEIVIQLGVRHPRVAELDARAELLDAFCRIWSEGRGRPVDRGTLERSGAISGRYLDAVCDIARELGADSRSLLEVLKDRQDQRLQGFRRRSGEQLKQFLVDEGYVDRRNVLGESEIVSRVMGTPVAARLPGEAVAEMVHRWWEISERAAFFRSL